MRPDIDAIEKRANAATPGDWDTRALIAYIRELEAQRPASDLNIAMSICGDQPKGIKNKIRAEIKTAKEAKK